MNSIKKLSVLFAALGLAFAASAASSVYWASVYTGAYSDKDGTPSTANAANYSVYLCTKAAAQEMVGSGTTLTVDSLTSVLSSDYTAWGTKLSGSGVTVLTSAEYGQGQYGFTQYFGEQLASGTYLAVALYDAAGSADSAVRVFGNMQTLNNGNLVFDDTYTTSGTVGAWTAASIPEPTSALLMLFGLAGLALKRKQA